MISDLAKQRLIWLPEVGVGYYPVESSSYDAAYFERYQKQAETPIGRALMRSRVDFVDRFYDGALCDVGIGSGAFIELRNSLGAKTFGWDVNPVANEWLLKRDLLRDPYSFPFLAISLWDVMEHIADFRPLLASAQELVFMSLPIFSGPAHVLRSKHYRKDEHYWYFTRDGLLHVMNEQGFYCVDESAMEVDAGREDIGAFAFRRR